jgi:UDP-3-O-[3-hydroxymyristoyl] glucosamine N-acyltransferase
MLTKEIADALCAPLTGDGAVEIKRIVHPDDAERSSDLAIAMTADSAAALARTKAQAVVVSVKRAPAPDRFKAVILIEQPRYALSILTALFDPGPAQAAGIHSSAVVAPDAMLGEGVNIGPYAVIGPGSRIGAGTAILPHVSVGARVQIGDRGLIYSGVRIGDRVVIGDRVLIKYNATIGSDGFSFAPELGPRLPYPADLMLKRVHSLGNVIIGDDVEIGAGTSIDRATLEATRIGNGTKIDNQVHIGHNVTIGEKCIICGKVGISGSVTIGDRVRIGGGAGIADHLTIGTAAIVGAGSGVGTNVPEGVFVFGYPAMRHQRTMEFIKYLGRQKALHVKVDDLKSRMAMLERAIKNEPS